MSQQSTDQWNDYNLSAQEIGELDSPELLINFFANLRYSVDGSGKVPHTTLKLDSDDFKQQILSVYKIATDPDAEEIEVYLLEARSVTQKLIQDIARRLRTLPGNRVLILTTKDYDKLHFVLLERILTERKTTGTGNILRPRVLTVDRRNPDVVPLRVLKRFTFTESDGLYQWDKLTGAYTLAEWSEPYFNNRALFSDYYLNHRLTDKVLTPEWVEDVRPAGRQVVELLVGARSRLTKQPEAQTRAELLEPLFTLLGFEYTANKPGNSDAEEPDYRLYAPDNPEQPIALALTYVWNRNLDTGDMQRDAKTPNENPGARVVSLLQKDVTQGGAPWVIVTNGKLWRLYSATTSNKATNYYEIDLEEAIADYNPDRVMALKYWWLMFRQGAFTGFLDKLLRESADYAKELGDRLKDSIFETVFPYFAEGFISDMEAQGVPLTEIDLQQVFTGTLTLLYRLIFILYAESLELVPVNEESGYRAVSLYTLKHEIDVVGGRSQDEASRRIVEAYSPDSNAIYRERLQKLFSFIDQGAPELNLPTYNGGLFSSSTPEGVFLDTYAIPDQYLAYGLDNVCRAIDEKTQGLVFIDFKSLGVRQLGSVYEGLLEFKLRIADEPLSVIREKGKEIYLTAKEAKKQGKRVLYTHEPGDVYLENDKRERKATGSYYTPDYIVKYIVENTVGPVLERKFEELGPQLREAQKRYRQHRDTVVARGGDQSPELIWDTLDMRQLADDCLSIRVLDPAMGSGHFLVEVVDYVSNRLIDFLNGWSENPVWAMLERTRVDIQQEVERQGVTVDFGRLTRVALLKRAVLKRCVYGVDLNLMAVELAKVSLWLDAFTLGAPLSFLDHHLKCGNSLIGARVREVQDYLAAREGQSYDMFSSSRFAGVMLATDLMRQVSYLSDNTVSQVQASQQAFHSASDHLAPFKRILDVYTSRWFGNAPQKRRGAHEYEPARELINHPKAEAWLRDPDANPLTQDYMDAKAVAHIAMVAAEKHRFLHWELEFPEVFFAPSTPGGQDVQLRENGGFDAAVGNPPYDVMEKAIGDVRTEELNRFVEYLSSNPRYESALGGKPNIFRFFVILWVVILHPQGQFGLIIPLSIATDLGCANLRRFLLTEHSLQRIDAFPDRYDPNERVFEDAKTSIAILIGANEKREDNKLIIQTRRGASFERNPIIVTASPEAIDIVDSQAFTYPLTSQSVWDLFVKIHCASNVQNLREIANVGAGEIHLTYYKPFFTDDPSYCEVIRGAEIQRFELAAQLSQGEKLYLDLNEAKKHLNPSAFDVRRIGMQRLTGTEDRYRFLATLIEPGIQLAHTTQYVLPNPPYHAAYMLALLSSRLTDQRFRITSGTTNVGVYEIEQLPFPLIDFTTSVDHRERLTNALIEGYEAGDFDTLPAYVRQEINDGHNDVVHDFLAHLAQQMMDLNVHKQAEVQRFIDLLESKLKIQSGRDGEVGIDTFTGKSIIQNYLGDYQKGEPELPWSDFEYRLHQNHNRFKANISDVKGQIQAEYEKSLGELLPIKQRLEQTDRLIDQIVYKLYGLTDEEIELIERPQYEQAVVDAKQKAVTEEDLKDDPEAAFEYVAAQIEPAAVRLAAMSPSLAAEASLDADFPSWRDLSERVQTLLSAAERDYLDEIRPDYTGSAINYAKVVEITLTERLFNPFRLAGYGETDVVNPMAFKPFMRGEKPLTLGNFPFLFSHKEATFRSYVDSLYPDAKQRIDGITALLTADQIASRNGSAHEDVVTRERAGAARDWALKVLYYLQ